MRSYPNIRYLIPVLLLTLTLGPGCQDIYEPDLRVEQRHLVVEGLITNNTGPHTIRLSYTGVFGEGRHRRPARNASVTITDSEGTVTELWDIGTGEYHTPVSFSARVAESYVLHIVTSEGEEFRSSPQEVPPPVGLSKVEAVTGSDFQYFESGVSGRLYQREFAGKHLYIETGNQENDPARFRFRTNLLLQYTSSVDLGSAPPLLEYCWQYREITNLVRRDVSSPESNRIQAAFIPRHAEYMQFYNFPVRQYASPRVVIMDIYSLNEESHHFYEKKHEQLSNEGHIFDPITAQLPSNIECISNPELQAIGLFEASSITRQGFRVIMNYGENHAEITTWEELEDIPRHGCLQEVKPPFWIGG